MSTDILRTDAVTKTFGNLRALDQVTMSVRDGEILGLVGPNGSGKSTMINVLSGFLRPSGGQIHFGDTRIDTLAPHRVAELGLARTYQIPRPFSTLSTLENVMVGGSFGRARTDRDPRTTGMQWLEFVGLGDQADDAAESLTLHQRKQLELARALSCEPRLIMLDEVLAGLNPTEIEGAIELIKSIRDLGIAVVFVEHNMRAVKGLCDRLFVLQSGQQIAEGDPATVLSDQAVIDAYLGSQHA
ncbi:ABC transporter ATP-binding protein [Ornithinimicrobium sp. F0845]|uniref:ABC transporter ATP-binding protein n=1 Tax=Ornithinimicrobium sp. F0845 TaxID=2926412 RepID=UPI001FF2C30B|nr:ABC transporter ATP-binding protein [Ornithinimicrobium sp. F0845]MCK0114226.1 ABC transporter ATP-binding protein [Ornithinimicrobium sp. F0845]